MRVTEINFFPKSLLLLFLFQSCSLPQIKKEAPQVNEIRGKSDFRVNLPEDHRSGYLWQLEDGFDKKVLEELNAVWHGNEKGIDYNFKPLAAGQTTLNFVLRKYRDTLNVKSYIVKITDN